MHPTTTAALSLLALLAFPYLALAAERAWVDVTVRVYDVASLPPADTSRALATAAGALAPAGLELRFLICGIRLVEAGCAETLAAGDIALRLVRRPLRQPHPPWPQPLGEALIDPRRRGAALTTIFVERVEALARHGRIDAALLMGRAIAHELVHALSGQSVHAPRGLMRAVWGWHELSRERADDWVLQAGETAALRARHRLRGLQATLR